MSNTFKVYWGILVVVIIALILLISNLIIDHKKQIHQPKTKYVTEITGAMGFRFGTLQTHEEFVFDSAGCGVIPQQYFWSAKIETPYMDSIDYVELKLTPKTKIVYEITGNFCDVVVDKEFSHERKMFEWENIQSLRQQYLISCIKKKYGDIVTNTRSRHYSEHSRDVIRIEIDGDFIYITLKGVVDIRYVSYTGKCMMLRESKDIADKLFTEALGGELKYF